MRQLRFVRRKGCFAIGIVVLIVIINSSRIQAKPANADAITREFHPSQPIPNSPRSLGSSQLSPSSSPGRGRKVLTSRGEDGSWQASARLPTSSKVGGSETSRYKIRRDGSLSLALQIPRPQSHLLASFAYNKNNNNRHRHGQGSLGLVAHESHNNWKSRGGDAGGGYDNGEIKMARHINTKESGNGTARGLITGPSHQYSPAELRSFSVVISDVDVTGNYDNVNKNKHIRQDAYSKAGVSSYHLKSNSIHRMNASWKLKPSHITPTSGELLEFLSYFANGGGEGRATRSETKEAEPQPGLNNDQHNVENGNQSKQALPSRQILGQGDDDPHLLVNEDQNKQPFLTWSETSRNIPLSSSTELIDTTMSSSSSPYAINNQTMANETDAMSDHLYLASPSSALSSLANIITAPVDSSSPPDTENGVQLGHHNGNENEGEVVLHELISKLGTLNEKVDAEERGRNDGGMGDDTIIKNSSENQTKNFHQEYQDYEDEEYQDEEMDEMTTYAPTPTTMMGLNHPHSPLEETELDQELREENKKEEEQVQPEMEMDVEMGDEDSMRKKEEKEGDVFAEEEEGDDAAEMFSSPNSNISLPTSTNIAHHLVNPTPTTINATESPTFKTKLERGTRKKRRNAKSALFHSPTTKSTNGNNDDGGGGGDEENNGNARGTSATSLFDSPDNGDSSQRMKIADTQQTAADLKKLMSLILKSDGNRNGNTGSYITEGGGGGIGVGGGDGKSGAQVVNIVITPNTDSYLPPSLSDPSSQSPQLKHNPQKILFLKNPQVKQMLDIALSDPEVSGAAQKIAAALESNPFPNPVPTNVDHTYNHLPLPGYLVKHAFGEGEHLDDYDLHEQDHDHHRDHHETDRYHFNAHSNNGESVSNNINTPSTPDGFPLTGPGYLNLHHPNLQFHQALHHMVVNGSTPTTINATTKTNIINIFVINFKENGNNRVETTTSSSSIPTSSPPPPSVNQQQDVNQSPFRIKIKPSGRPTNFPYPFSIKPLLVDSSVSTSSPLLDLHRLHPSRLFNNKMGLAADADADADFAIHDEQGENGGEKNYEPNKQFGTDQYALSNPSESESDKINIFDLLPGDIGTVTAVHYAPAVGNDEQDHSQSQQAQQQPHNNQPLLSSHILDELVGLNNGDGNSNDFVNGKNNTDNGNTMKPTTMKYGDYFADFLPDRSRDPPGIIVGGSNHHHNHNQNMNEHDILSILTSQKPSPLQSPQSSSSSSPSSSGSNGFLPPALAHLEWIFKNQLPPKPQISPQSNPLSKRKGETDAAAATTSSYEGGGSDSMMEADETSISPATYQGSTTQELVDFLLKLQNVAKGPSDTNDLIDGNSTVPMNLEALLANLTKEGNASRSGGHLHQNHHNNLHGNQNVNSNSSESEEQFIVEYTTTKKPPVFWKFGNKFPIGSISNTEEALNNRLRKVLTAFGYSALPTLAAGAAATWPYWVPLMATGRRRRRKRSSQLFSTHPHPRPLHHDDDYDEKQNSQEVIKRRAHQFLSNLMMTENKNSSVEPILGPSDRQLLSKSTKNLQREGDKSEEKWIKVDVITTATPAASSSSSSSSSPTLLHLVEEMSRDNNGTSFHSKSKTDNANHSLSPPIKKKQQKNDDSDYDDSSDADRGTATDHKRQQQLDYPILKNFLKNVLYNEFSPHPTKIPSVVVSSTVAPLFTPSPLSSPISSSSSSPSSSFLSSSPSASQTSNKNFNRIITKNGEHTLVTTINSSNNRPFSRPSSTPLPSSLQFSPHRGNNKGSDSEQMIAGSDEKFISLSQFSTPSPSSVYIYNRGDGTTTAASSFAHSHSQSSSQAQYNKNKNGGGGGGSGSNNKNNNPWGLFSFGDGQPTMGHYYPHHPDKIGSATTTVTTVNGHDKNNHNQHYNHNHNQHFAHYHETNKRLHKLQLADSIKAAEKSYTSAALLPLWLPLFFSEHSQLSAKFKESLLMKKLGVGG